MVWILAVGLYGCGGPVESGVQFTLSDVIVEQTGTHRAAVRGTITLNSAAAGIGAESVTTFYRDEYMSELVEVTDFIGGELETEGDSEDFEISTIQASLLPNNDGLEQICVGFKAANTNMATPSQLGCLEGEPEVTTPTTPPTTTTPPPEAPPVVEIRTPNDLGILGVDEDIYLDGVVADENQDRDTLVCEWTVTPVGGGASVVVPGGETPSNGDTSTTWEMAPLGDWIVRLEATDDTDMVGYAEVFVSVIDRDYADLDNDGYTPIGGDCDDNDPYVNPDADEACDGADTDCSGEIDDKDLDGDLHVDENCGSYTGALPVDDCDDTDPYIHPGRPEQIDGVDSDCDGNDD